MSLLKLSKEELKRFAESSDVWQVRDRMAEMLNEIENAICTLDLVKTDYNRNRVCGSVVVDRFLTKCTLILEYNTKDGKKDKITIKQTGDAPLIVSTEISHVALIAKLVTKAIEEINKEGYFTNKKLIKQLDKVVYLGREYLKYYRLAYSGEPPTWVDENIAALKWTPNANLRVLTMLKAAKKMEKALEGVKEHLRIDPFKEVTVDDKTMINLTFSRLSDDIDQVTLDADIKIFANLILNPISIYLKEECPDLPEKDRRRILQSRVAVLALIQIRPPQTEAFEAVNQAVLAVMMA